MNQEPSILIVDDNPENLRLLVDVFKRQGLRVRPVLDGAAALELVDRFTPDLILLDILMPEMDGYETCRRIKSRETCRDVPVIFVSALKEPLDIVKALEVGGVDFVTKPFNTEELSARVHTHLSLREAKRTIEAKNKRLEHEVQEREIARKEAEAARLEAEAARLETRQERDRFRVLSEAAFEGIVFFDSNGIVDANPAMEAITGYSRRQLTGMDLLRLFATRSRERVALFLKSPGNQALEVPVIRKDGAKVAVELRSRIVEFQKDRFQMLAVRDISRTRTLEFENTALRAGLEKSDRFGDMVGKSAPMKTLYDHIIRSAMTDETVLISGETGTGKELAARTIFDMSASHTRKFVVVNCAAVVGPLFESMFFGHVKGSFTGATERHDGFFKEAEGGTLFLDEIGELPVAAQAKLLRVLQDGDYTPIGSAKPKTADVRIIAATNRDLRQMVEEGVMRDDFYHRINVIHLRLPPLRKRNEDIPLLANHFLENNRSQGTAPVILDAEQLKSFQEYHWPGNVRELFNKLRRFAAIGELSLEYAREPERAEENGGSFVETGQSLSQAVESFEKRLVLRAIDACGGQKKLAAERLGVDRKTLYNKLQKYGLGTKGTG